MVKMHGLGHGFSIATPTKYLKVIVNDHHTNEYGDKHISEVSKIITPPENFTIDPFDYRRRSWFPNAVHDSPDIVLLVLSMPVSSCRFGLGPIQLPFGVPNSVIFNASAEKNFNDSWLLAAANNTRPPFVKNMSCYFAGWGAVTNESAEIGNSTVIDVVIEAI
uniref:Uncharacterized protein n=1 Tax=Plectus sambesii TaxID=2011161 RepID=A0A914WGF2_9BILA